MTGNKSGMTVVELMVVLLLAAAITAAIYKTFPAHQKAVISQEQVTEMQQQVRAAMTIMQREIRMAGYDPLRSTSCGSWILAAKANEMQFALDVTGGESDGFDNDGDGFVDDSGENIYPDGDCADTNETITYSLYTNPRGIQTLGRKASVSGLTQTIAENLEALGFAYAFDADGDGQLDRDLTSNGIIWAIDANGDGLLCLNLDTNHDSEVDENDDPAGQVLNPPIAIGSIKAVKIWLLARSEQPDVNYTNTSTYAVSCQRITVNDGYRRRLLSATVYCQNLGL